ncbi:MAG TPA: DinB family protein [Streptosporangiaceae bacterium]|nr:DinB family protein [Streptosporangiaceae bacterium]
MGIAVWTRLTDRIEGLTDEEYFWEPVAGCWSLRPGGEGRWHLDGGGGGGPAPDPVPVTTIAWRLGHLGGMAVGGFANRRFGDSTLTTEVIHHGAEVGLLRDLYSHRSSLPG